MLGGADACEASVGATRSQGTRTARAAVNAAECNSVYFSSAELAPGAAAADPTAPSIVSCKLPAAALLTSTLVLSAASSAKRPRSAALGAPLGGNACVRCALSSSGLTKAAPACPAHVATCARSVDTQAST